MLTFSAALQRLQLVTRRKTEVAQRNSGVESRQECTCAFLQTTREAFTVDAIKGIGGSFAFGALDHESYVSYSDTYIKRRRHKTVRPPRLEQSRYFRGKRYGNPNADPLKTLSVSF
jgi:hypothetical protein